MKKIFKIITGIILLFIVFIIGIIGYSLYFEKEKIKIDEYNFKQLEIVDEIIMNDIKYEYLFRNLGDFNQIYNSNIEPIKNCYYISNRNGEEKYIFGFKLESLFYKIKYRKLTFAYPKYDLGYGGFCTTGGCSDINLGTFNRTISHPCKD